MRQFRATTRRRSRLGHALAAVLAGAALALAGAPAASASLGSVPEQVAQYAESGALVDRLADIYGPDATGGGIDFDDSAKLGELARVHVFTEDKLAGRATEHPVRMVNEWTVPVSVDGDPVGVATIWINPQTARPELAEFDADADAAAALSDLPAKAALVRDSGNRAWFALASGTLTPIVPGLSGLSTPAPVDDVVIVSDSAPPVTESATGGVVVAVVAAAVIFAVIVAALIVSARIGRRRDGADGPGAAAPAGPPDASDS